MHVTEHNKLATFGTLKGTIEEVRNRLSRSSADHVIALTFTHEKPGTVQAVAEMLNNMGPLVSSILERRQREVLTSIIEALVPSVPLPDYLLTEARMTAEARKAMLVGAEWLTAAQVAQIAGLSTTNPSAQPNKWKKEGRIFAIHHEGSDYFPGYGLDPKAGYRPVKSLADILRVFKDTRDSWGLAYWFGSVNSYLGGKKPQDMLIQATSRVLAAAHSEMAEIAHG